MPKQTNMTLSDKTLRQSTELMAQDGKTRTVIVEEAVDMRWRFDYMLTFNQACTRIGITGQREAFAAYWADKRDEADEVHPISVWEIIYRCFEDSQGTTDERDTQADALQ